MPIEVMTTTDAIGIDRAPLPSEQIGPVLALVPPDPKCEQPARYSFVSEELIGHAGCGMEIHTVSPFALESKMARGVRLHPIPRLRDIAHTVRSLSYFVHRDIRPFVTEARWSQRLLLARFQAAIERVIRRHRIRVIYSPFAWPMGTAGMGAAMRTGVPVVISLRGSDVLTDNDMQVPGAAYRTRLSHALRRATHVIAVSQALADRALALGVSPQRVSVILKGVDQNRFSPGNPVEARKRLGLPERPTILFVGDFVPRKGLAVLLSAFQRARSELPETQLILCGDGRQQEELAASIQRYSLTSHVAMPGRIPRELIPDYFRACDVFVLPSLGEGSGNVLVEAAATGKPLVGARVDGIPDYIHEGETGLLFETENISDLSRQLVRIMSDQALAQQLGHAARRRVEHHHQYGEVLRRIQLVLAGAAVEATGSISEVG